MHQRLPFPRGGCHPPWFSLRSTIATTTTTTTTTSGNGLDPRRNNPGSKGWGGRCSVTVETRRAVRHPFPRCIQPWGCDPRSKMQRYLDNGNYPRQGHVSAYASPWSLSHFLFSALHPQARGQELTHYIPPWRVICHAYARPLEMLSSFLRDPRRSLRAGSGTAWWSKRETDRTINNRDFF